MNTLMYRADIQGLRAVAVLSVIIFHFNPNWLPGGFVGVDVFLVISGFLITSVLLSRQNNNDFNFLVTLKFFFISRFKRIFPAYLAMLVIVLSVSSVFLSEKDFNEFLGSFFSAVWFQSNNYFSDFGGYFSPSSHEQTLLHTWSLSVEIQFYMLAPFIILLLSRASLIYILAVLVIVLCGLAEVMIYHKGSEQAVYYSLYARLPEFFIGALVAIYTLNRVEGQSCFLGVVGILMVALAVFLQPDLGSFPGLNVLLPTVGAALLLLNTKSFISRFLSNKFLVFIGFLSYSLYLWHWPVLAILRYYSGSEILSWNLSLVFFLLTVLLSLVSYYMIENKLTRVKLGGGKFFLKVFSFFSLLLISFFISKYNYFLPEEGGGIEYKRYANPEVICHGKIVRECFFGDLASDREILVLGDSHAAMLNLFFDYLGKELGFKARIVTASSCVTIPNFDYIELVEWARAPCQSQIAYAKEILPKASEVIIAASWNWQFQRVSFQKALHDFLQSGVSNESKIYFLSQVPLLKSNPQRRKRFLELGFHVDNGIDPDYKRTNSMLGRMVEAFPNVTYLDFGDVSLFDDAPYYNGKLMYFDKDHLNEVGAMVYAAQAKPYFEHIFMQKAE